MRGCRKMGSDAHLAPQRTRKSAWKVWQGSQAITHCHRECGPDLNPDAGQLPAAGCAMRYDTYSPAINAEVMNCSCTKRRGPVIADSRAFAEINQDADSRCVQKNDSAIAMSIHSAEERASG
jgi:hypothetical protein